MFYKLRLTAHFDVVKGSEAIKFRGSPLVILVDGVSHFVYSLLARLMNKQILDLCTYKMGHPH